MSLPILYDKAERVQTPAIADIGVADLTVIESERESANAFYTQGLGTLTDAISCKVTEKRNGSYELSMQYPINGVHFKDIQCRNIILAKPNFSDDPQPFRIYKITKPLNGICTVYAQHISYDLNGYAMPVGQAAVGASFTSIIIGKYASPFSIETDITDTSTVFRTYEPTSIRPWLGGKEGSMLDLWGGEWHWDGYTCTLMGERGADRGVTIRYGKNLTSFRQDEDYSNVYSGLIAYWRDSDTGVVVQSDLVRTGTVLDDTRTFILDATSDFSVKPTKAQLTTRGRAYLRQNNLKTPRIGLSLNFVQLSQLGERVDLCDTVSVIFEDLDVSTQVKCIETTWDVLNDRYSSTKFGEPIKNIANTIANLEKGQK